jgi:hypothetical protein
MYQATSGEIFSASRSGGFRARAAARFAGAARLVDGFVGFDDDRRA